MRSRPSVPFAASAHEQLAPLALVSSTALFSSLTPLISHYPPVTSPMRHERSQLRLLLFVIIALIVGVGLLGLGANISDTHKFWSQFSSAIGGALFASVALAGLWEFWQKEAFTDEVLYRGQGIQGLRTAGVLNFSPVFQKGIDWERLFKKANHIELFFMHAQGWRSNNSHFLEQFIKRGGRLRVALPDPDNHTLMQDLASRTEWTTEDTSKGVRDAANFFLSLDKTNQTTVEVWYVPRPPLFSFYRFGDETVLAFNSHRLGKVTVPTFVVERAGDLDKFIEAEWNGLLLLKGSRRVESP